MDAEIAGKTQVSVARTDPTWVESVPAFVDRDMGRWLAIGQGFQYSAYARGDDVLKIPLTAEQTARKFEKLNIGSVDIEQIRADRAQAMSVISETRERLQVGTIPAWLLADAQINEAGEVRQSRVIPFGKVFEAVSHAEKLELLASYGNCCEQLMRHGAFETGFALLSNFGVNRDGKVVAMDFGELTYSQSQALDIVDRRVWEDKREAVNELKEPYKSAYLEVMNRILTRDSILENWEKGA